MQKLREQNSTKYQKNNIRRQIFISPVMKKPRFQIQNQGLLYNPGIKAALRNFIRFRIFGYK